MSNLHVLLGLLLYIDYDDWGQDSVINPTFSEYGTLVYAIIVVLYVLD